MRRAFPVILYILFFFYGFGIYSQGMFSHNSSITEICVDDLGQTIVLDEDMQWTIYKLYSEQQSCLDTIEQNQVWKGGDGGLYRYLKGELFKFKGDCFEKIAGKLEFQPVGVYDNIAWLNDNGILRITGFNYNLCSKSFPIESEGLIKLIAEKDKIFALSTSTIFQLCPEQNSFKLPFKAESMSFLDNAILISSSETGLWVLEDGGIKKFFLPGVRMPQRVREMIKRDHYLWIFGLDQAVYVYDIRRQLLNKLTEKAESYAVDQWNVLHYSVGNVIYTDVSYINKTAPFLHLTNVFVNGQERGINHEIEIQQGDRLGMDLVCYYPDHSKDIRIEYRVDDGPWLIFKDDIVANFRKPRKYKLDFRVGIEGGVMEYDRSFNLTVRQKLEFSLWPYVFAALFLLSLLLLLGWIMRGRTNKKLQHKAEELLLKLDLAHKEQKLHQTRMSPHFLFNALNSIKGLIATGELKSARRAIDGFARIMRTVLEDTEKDRIRIDEEIEFLSAYLELEKHIKPYPFDYSIENLADDSTEIPPMMIQAFVENSIIHGLPKAKGKGLIRITFKDEGSYIQVSVEDNGAGLQNEKTADHLSKATEIFQSRTSILDKWKTREPISYHTLYDANGNVSGLRCILNIPK